MILTSTHFVPLHVDNLSIMLKNGTIVSVETEAIEIKCEIDDRTGNGVASIIDPTDVTVEFEVKNTHKMTRTLRKFRKEQKIKKPRVPRKEKKARKKALGVLDSFIPIRRYNECPNKK